MITGDVISEQKENLDIQDIEKAKRIFEYLGFDELVEVKYHVVVFEKDGMELAFQIVDNLGVLIEYENNNDFEGKTINEINNIKQIMLEEIRKTGVNVTNEFDVKKAHELILKRFE